MRTRLLLAATILVIGVLGCDSPGPHQPHDVAATTAAGSQDSGGVRTLDRDARRPATGQGEDAFFTYREDANDPTDDRLVVLLHGYGADERDLVGAARRVGLRGPLLSVRGPERAGRGWSWFPINFRAARRYPPDAADRVLERLAAFLAQEKSGHDGEVVVLGFSQGAMMAMMLAVEHPDSVDRAIALSGTLPRPVQTPDDWDPATAPLIYAIHGKADTVIPLERARQAQKWLEEAGAEPTYMEYDGMKHTIGDDVVNDLQNYLRR